MSAEDQLQDIKSILAQIRDQGTVSSGVGSQSSQDVEQFTRELRLARQELDLLDESSAAYNRKLKEVDKLTRQTRNAMKDQRRESDLLSISMNGIAGAMDIFSNALDKVVVKFAGLVSSVMDEAKKLDSLTVEFQRSTAASAEMASNIGALSDRLRIYGVSSEEADKATRSLYAGMPEFSRLSGDQQFAIAQTTTLMNELGVSFETSTRIMEIGTRGLGMSLEDTQGLLVDMRLSARALEVPLEQLTADFLNAESRIIGMGKNGVQEFKNMAAAAKATGTTTGDLISIAGKFDNITDAQRAAQRLNAMMEGGFFDSRTLNRLADSPTELAAYIREGMEAGSISMEDLTGKNRRLGNEFASVFGVDLPTTIKLLSGDIGELQEQVEQSTYSLEDMRKEAFGLKGFDEVVNNMFAAFKRPVSDIQQAGRATFEGLITSGVIGRFEKFNARLIESTSTFVNKNQKLIGGISMLYNVANIDGVQKGYEIFKGIAGYTGDMLSNMFSFKGLLALMAGGILYSIRDSLGDIYDAFMGPKGGFFAGITKFYDVIMDKFTELKDKAVDLGFNQEFFEKGVAVFESLAMVAYQFMNLHLFGPIKDFFMYDLLDIMLAQVVKPFMAIPDVLEWILKTVGQMIVDIFSFAVTSVLKPLTGITLGGIGNLASSAVEALTGTKNLFGLVESDEEKKKKNRAAREAELNAAMGNVGTSFSDFRGTKGAQAVETAIATKVTPHVTKAIQGTLGAGGQMFDSMKNAAKEGYVEGAEIAREMNAGVDSSLANRARGGDVNLDRQKVGEHLLGPALMGRR